MPTSSRSPGDRAGQFDHQSRLPSLNRPFVAPLWCYSILLPSTPLMSTVNDITPTSVAVSHPTLYFYSAFKSLTLAEQIAPLATLRCMDGVLFLHSGMASLALGYITITCVKVWPQLQRQGRFTNFILQLVNDEAIKTIYLAKPFNDQLTKWLSHIREIHDIHFVEEGVCWVWIKPTANSPVNVSTLMYTKQSVCAVA